MTWEQPYFIGDPTVQGGNFENLKDNLTIDRYEVRWKRDTGEYRTWQPVDFRVPSVVWEGEQYESRVDKITEFPFAGGTPTQSGLYTFQGKAVTNQNVEGEIIETSMRIE